MNEDLIYLGGIEPIERDKMNGNDQRLDLSDYPKPLTELDKFPIEALVPIVERETAMINADIKIYGEHQFDPRTPAFKELAKRFEKALPA